MKAISAVIAAILMLMLTMALAGSAYFIVNNLMSGKTEAVFTIVEKSQNAVKVRNDGTTPITKLSVIVDDGQADFAVVPEGAVGYWKMDSVNGSNYTLDFTRNNDGRLYNYPCNPATCNLTDGKYGKALRFDGVNDYVDVGNGASLQSTTLSIEAWVKAVNGGSIYTIVARGHDFSLALYIGSIVISSFDPQAYQTTTSTSWSYDNQWVHIVAIVRPYMGSWTAQLYVNGVKKGEQTATAFDGPSNNEPSVDIGRWSTTSPQRFWNGLIDEVRIYNRALSADEIKANYDCNSDVCIMPGKIGIIKILNPLYKGSHVVEICVSATCVRDTITVN